MKRNKLDNKIQTYFASQLERRKILKSDASNQNSITYQPSKHQPDSVSLSSPSKESIQKVKNDLALIKHILKLNNIRSNWYIKPFVYLKF